MQNILWKNKLGRRMFFRHMATALSGYFFLPGRPQLWQGRKQVPNSWLSGGPWASRNLLWGRGATWDGTAFFGPCAVNCTNDREVYSFHTGGANVVFADGHVHFLRESINIRVLARLITRAGGEVVSAGDF